MLGTVSANAATVASLKNTVRLYGLCEGPDDVFLGLRGLRTMAIRLDRHFQSGLAVGQWLEQRPEVLRMLHPAMPSHPDHALWKRDFTGACGLFSMVLKPVPQQAVYAFLDTLSCSASAPRGAAIESLAIRSTARRCARQRRGSPADPPCGFISAWKPSRI